MLLSSIQKVPRSYGVINALINLKGLIIKYQV